MVRTTLKTGRPLGRRGVTLTEVLVAMFVMAIGMISLLTLFPLGAMQVGQALRDDRATQLARQADAFVRQSWRNEIIPRGGNNEGYYWAMDDPYLVAKYSDLTPNSTLKVMRFVGSDKSSNSWYNSVLPVSATPPAPFAGFGVPAPSPSLVRPTTFTLTNDFSRPVGGGFTPATNEFLVESFGVTTAGPSFPVLLDPAGVGAYGASDPNRGWVAQTIPSIAPAFPTHPSGIRIPRRTCQLVNPINPFTPTFPSGAGSVTAFELTTLVDDMAFQANGSPSGTELGRQGRYSWAALIQRPFNEHRNYADLSILVFDKRPALPQPGDELVVAPVNTQVLGDRTVRVTLPNRTGDTSPVLLRRGGWIIDGTIDATTGTNTRRQFFAYRVSGFTEGTIGATTTQYDVDLETPLKADLTLSSQLYLFAGLIEVFSRPQLRPDTGY